MYAFLCGYTFTRAQSRHRFPQFATTGRPCDIFAPMQGVTDRSMRELWGERGGFTFCVSEYLRVSEHALPAKVFYAHVPEIWIRTAQRFGAASVRCSSWAATGAAGGVSRHGS